MDAASYERFTERLRERLEGDDAVLGLIALAVELLEANAVEPLAWKADAGG
jgi:hypothetical protein